MAKFVTKAGKFLPVIGSLVDLGIFVADAIRERRLRKKAALDQQKLREARERVDGIVKRAKEATRK